MRVYDRSRVVKDWQCPRARFYGYEFDGRGLVNPHTSLELTIGICVHDGLAVMAEQQKATGNADIDLIADTARAQMTSALLDGDPPSDDKLTFANEQGALVEGLLRGFHKHVWSRLMREYTIAALEQEMQYEHDGLLFMSRPDLLLADAEGMLTYLEYKTTSSKKEEWINSWDTAIQLHSTIKAVEATLGKQVQQVIVQGLYKGYASYGKQHSPFCYAFKKSGNPPFTQDQISYEYKAGLKKSPSWEEAGGVKRWVENMPDSVLAEQFPATPPIFVKHDMVDAFFKQRAIRETEITNAMQMIKLMPAQADQYLDGFFPQKFDQCSPAYGRGCMFKRICHGSVTDPLNEGYQYREPHHQQELEMFQEETA